MTHDDYIQKLVAAAPPLTGNQRAAIAKAFSAAPITAGGELDELREVMDGE